MFVFSDNTANTASSGEWAKQGGREVEEAGPIEEPGAGQVPHGARLHAGRSAGAAPAGRGCARRPSGGWSKHGRVLVAAGIRVTPWEDGWKRATVGAAFEKRGSAGQACVTARAAMLVRINCPEPTRERTFVSHGVVYWKRLTNHIGDDSTSRSHHVGRPQLARFIAEGLAPRLQRRESGACP